MAVGVEATSEFSFAPPQLLFVGPYVWSEIVPTYDVAPDGRFLMILPEGDTQAVAPGSIVVVQNFGEEIKQRVRPSAK